MIIGFDGSRAFGKGDKTGTENYSYYLLKALAEIDKKNQYIVYLRPKTEDQEDDTDWPANFKFKILNHKFLWTQVGLGLQTFKDDLDCLFVPSHTLPLIRKPGLKTIMTVHDLGAEYLPTMHQLKQAIYLKAITKYQLQTASKLIAISNATKQDLISRARIPAEKIKVVYEGVDRLKFYPENMDTVARVLGQFGLKRGSYLLYLGTIQPRKNLKRLIEAFAKMKNQELKLVLVGKKGWLSDEIYAFPGELGIKDQVLFLGYQPDEVTRALLTAAAGMVYPSLFEGFGLPILEGFACECPVLTSNISSMPEVAGEGAILVDPLSVSSICKGMEALLDKHTTGSLKAYAHRQLDKFTWEKCATETLKLFENVAK